ncbi:MAG: M1 family metallopeptidase [Caulobacter sp.]|nr:M1 family metallopeptidase [Caulobacter sp.]
MSQTRRALLFSGVAIAAAPALTACASLSAPWDVSPPEVAPILLTDDAVDTQSYARPREARVTHVDLDIVTDFDAHTVSGTAALTILARPGASEVVLDTLDLAIRGVTDGAGRPLRWALGAADGAKGAPLTVQLDGASRVVVAYSTGAGALALQWLPPELTAGKAAPYLYSQGQPTLNRSWIPTQDSPGVRQSWTARVVAPEGLTVVMSGEKLTPKGEPAGPGRRAFRFRMTHPTAPYLIAIAAGDLAFQPLGPRTGVYTEPSMMGRAAYELADTEKMVAAAESLYGPYRWGRYDVLVLPPAFPYGGMENTTLTFLTPTFITGDRANVGLVAHELAHSWSGNLVTNATWDDVWLNEGFTSYVENRIMEVLYGPARAGIEADLSWDELQRDVAAGPAAAVTLFGQGTTVEYVKGEAFLRTLEHAAGRGRWDAYLRGYFDRFAFQPQTTAGFLADLREHLVKGDAALEAKMQLDEWVYQPGVPSGAYHLPSPALLKVDAARAAFLAGGPVAAIPGKGWTTQEWKRFLDGLPRKLTAAQLAELDGAFGLSASTNAYVRSGWLELVVANRWAPGLPSLEQFLGSVGRGLFIRPLYTGLSKDREWGLPLARRFFNQSKATYHPSLAAGIEKTIAAAEGK